MTPRFPSPSKLAIAAGLTLLSLTACSSGPRSRGGPPPGGMPGGGNGPGGRAGINGPIARPVSLLFAGMDIDRDMIVTREEAVSAGAHEWQKLAGGEGHVGTLALSDWLILALGSPDAQPATVAFDNNFDGVITRGEFDTRLAAEFDRLDADKDGRLIRKELVFDAASLRRERGGATQMRPEGPPGGPGR